MNQLCSSDLLFMIKIIVHLLVMGIIIPDIKGDFIPKNTLEISFLEVKFSRWPSSRTIESTVKASSP